LQIALFVAPVLIFFSYLFGQPMDLEFTLPEVVAVIVALHLVFQINGDGETNWLEGVQLLSVYLILGILFLPAGESARGLNPIDVHAAVQLDQRQRVSAFSGFQKGPRFGIPSRPPVSNFPVCSVSRFS
jgi:hypothetical protein